jgi:predicted RNA-binding protein with PUA-like domain
MANRWLVKTEPSSYSFQQLQKDKRTTWDGVKNNLALIHIRAVRKGDWLLVYHSGKERSVVGVARATTGAYPDPTKKDPKLVVFDIEASKPLPRPVALAEIKAQSRLAKLDLVRISRLSVMPVNDEQWKIITGLAAK